MKKILFPQPDRTPGEWLNLNGPWDFSLETKAYDRTIEVPYPWGSPLSGISEETDGTGYYRRTVRWNPANPRIFLKLGAVDYTCKVSLNGQLLGEHTGGYMPFGFEVTDLWNRDGDNCIQVEATDISAKSQTYGKQGYGNARGIWQTPWLEARPAAYIDDFTVVTKLDGTVTYTVTTVDAPDGTVLTADFGELTASATVENNQAKLTLTVTEPKLWTPEEPNLYDGKLTLGEDSIETYFGIREIGTGKFGPQNRHWITLNGKPYYINGVLDQSFNPQGFFTLPADQDCRDEILRLKRIGINMARIHIKAEEPLKLYWADRLGLLIMADIPCFWGEPTPETKAQYEIEMAEQIRRDRNHPAIFYWVIFNETWGLFHLKDEAGNDCRIYRPETAEWVVDCYHKAKALDPTRLVEDNSPCNRDHTVTDVNTWHFYSNGYGKVKNVVESFCDGAYVGSQANYKDGYTMADVPCMNSECGNVWGIQGNAGESDISWQYKYMMNEFRLHDKLCGFVFTEFHDVVNEFNGYYKLNNDDKDFGYDLYGMTLRDLHSQDYLGADCPPMMTVKPGECVKVPLFGSSFTDVRHGKLLNIAWQLTVLDPVDGDWAADAGEHGVVWSGYGTFPAGEISFEVPDHDGLLLLTMTLCDGDQVIMQNGFLYDVDGVREDGLALAPADFTAVGFDQVIPAKVEKVSGLGKGAFTLTVQTADIPGFAEATDLRLLAEVSTRFPMTHDFPEKGTDGRIDLNYMLGYRCDPGANKNSYPQTDETPYPGSVTVTIDGMKVTTVHIPDAPADSRGALSHHYQPVDNLLDEAGSYGTLIDVRIPSAVLLALRDKESFTLTFETAEEAGLALYGRRSGRYGVGILLLAE